MSSKPPTRRNFNASSGFALVASVQPPPTRQTLSSGFDCLGDAGRSPKKRVPSRKGRIFNDVDLSIPVNLGSSLLTMGKSSLRKQPSEPQAPDFKKQGDGQLKTDLPAQNHNEGQNQFDTKVPRPNMITECTETDDAEHGQAAISPPQCSATKLQPCNSQSSWHSPSICSPSRLADEQMLNGVHFASNSCEDHERRPLERATSAPQMLTHEQNLVDNGAGVGAEKSRKLASPAKEIEDGFCAEFVAPRSGPQTKGNSSAVQDRKIQRSAGPDAESISAEQGKTDEGANNSIKTPGKRPHDAPVASPRMTRQKTKNTVGESACEANEAAQTSVDGDYEPCPKSRRRTPANKNSATCEKKPAIRKRKVNDPIPENPDGTSKEKKASKAKAKPQKVQPVAKPSKVKPAAKSKKMSGTAATSTMTVQKPELVAHGLNLVKADYKRCGKNGSYIGSLKKVQMNKYYGKNGKLKLDPSNGGAPTTRNYKKLRYQRLAKEKLSERTLQGAEGAGLIEEKDPVFSGAVSAKLLNAAAASGPGLGEIAEVRPPDEVLAETSNSQTVENSIEPSQNQPSSKGDQCPVDEADQVAVEGEAASVDETRAPQPVIPLKAPQDYTPDDLDNILQSDFGHERFRPGQREAISNILVDKKTLLILATGAGKSLCYQFPAYLLREEGLTLVVSPLVSLMADQLRRLPHCLRGAVLSGQQTREQARSVMKAVRSRLVDVLFVSPERLSMWSFSGCGLPPVALACVDEAHCVSEWSHDFRPDYLRLHEFLCTVVGARRLLALTATATRPTMLSLCKILSIDTVVRSDRSFTMQEIRDSISATPKVQRPNLIMDVRTFGNDEAQLLECINVLRNPEVAKESTIIYVWKRASTYDLSKRLRSIVPGGVQPYNGAMPPEERRRVQDAFMAGVVKVVVATLAFGMGLDKPDIRTVIHMGMPKTLENYVQETGRCSRDGLKGKCITLLCPQNYKSMRWMETGGGGNGAQLATIRRLLALLKKTDSTSGQQTCSELSDEAIRTSSLTVDPDDMKDGWRPYNVAFGEKEVSEELKCNRTEIHATFSHLAYRAKEYFYLCANFPTKLKLRFFGQATAAELQECDPLLRRVLPHAKKTGSVHTVDTARVLADMGGKPGHLSNGLWHAQGGDFAVERDGYGFMITILKPIDANMLEKWADEIEMVNKAARANSVEKLDASYIALQRAAEAGREKADADAKKKQREGPDTEGDDKPVEGAHEKLDSLINDYFSSKGADNLPASASGDRNLRNRLMREALGRDMDSEINRASSKATNGTVDNSEANERRILEATAVYRLVARLVMSPDWPHVQSGDQASEARVVTQFLAGISSVMFPAKNWGRHRCWGCLRNFGDFENLENFTNEALTKLGTARAAIRAKRAAAAE